MKHSGRSARRDPAPEGDASAARLPLLLLHGTSWDPSAIAVPLAVDRVATRAVADPHQIRVADRPTVLLLDADAVERFGVPALARLVDSGLAIALLGAAGSEDLPEHIPPHLPSAYLVPPIGASRLLLALRAAFREAAARQAAREAAAETANLATEATDLTGACGHRALDPSPRGLHGTRGGRDADLRSQLPYLTRPELDALRVRQGSLDGAEWAEMRRHVSLTHCFLSTIPWTSEPAGVPGIAHGHHEKLDGSGYPRGLSAADIPLQCRMMTVAEILTR